jgi:hypothetical protein
MIGLQEFAGLNKNFYEKLKIFKKIIILTEMTIEIEGLNKAINHSVNKSVNLN